MTFRTRSLRAGAIATALLVAACGGTGPSGAAGTQQPAATPAATPDAAPTDGALPSLDLGSFVLPSFTLPSFTSDAELEALLPDEIDGTTVIKQSLSGADFLALGMGGGDALEPMLDELDASIDDLSVAFGSAGPVVVIAYQLKGVAAQQLFAGLEAAFQAGEGGSVSQTTVAGRNVTKVTGAGSTGETTYIYLAGDVVFIIGGVLTSESLADAISQLPG